MTTARFDAITIEELRARGGIKWSRYPGKIGAFIAEMDFDVAPPITRALHEGVDEGAFGYLPPPLVDDMARACAEWYRTRYGWDVPAARIRPMADVIAAFTATIRFFTRPGSPIILPTPAYMPFLTEPAALGREVIQVPMRDTPEGPRYDLDALDRAFAAGGHLLVLCNPHNPIGRVLTRDEMLEISEVVARHDGRVFADEIHAPLVYPGHRHVPYASLSEVTAAHTITATSASKAWNLPGLKCAQMIFSNEADLETWFQVSGYTEYGTSNLGLVANTAAYAAGGPWLDEVIGYLDGNRRHLAELLAEHLPQVRYTPPEGTYLAWLDCRELDLDGSPADFFADRADVVLTDGAACGEAGVGFVRFNFATPRPIMRLAVERMAKALSER
ncbi:aminotransferase [Thermopolyspora flexuosa]|uniref:cysteine-S-conjugate beta-lyase n=1 Tax=Thermopolyspora flexuosa TaxID=103836 RepID=A0A543IPE3_9ACTN|nr:MalY/PatB family protein [Thermopolyspora flexuosa]TQM72431.1 cystathionine beta-lyase [Thermopolyspora flexuosa]GGM70653.1 aminotransferase [Thermopolyspora flexuosa]